MVGKRGDKRSRVRGAAARDLAHHGLARGDGLDGLAKEAERGALRKRQALVVVLQKDYALGGNLLVKGLLGVLDGVSRVVGLAVLQVKTVRVGLGVVPVLLVAQDVVGHAANRAQHARQDQVRDPKHGHKHNGTFRTLFITRPTLRAVLIFFATASPSVMGFSPNISLRSAYVQVARDGRR